MAQEVSGQQVAKLSADERQAFTDAYRFYERYHNIPNTVEAWVACADEVNRIVSGYEDKNLIENLLSSIYIAIENRVRGEIKQQNA